MQKSGARSKKQARRRQASSLITTLLVIVVLSTIVIAFLQSMSVERMTARSIVNHMRAEWGAESGLNVCLESIRSEIVSNRAYIVFQTNHQPSLSPVLMIRTFSGSNSLTLPLMSMNLEKYLAERATNASALTNFLQERSLATSNAADVNRLRGAYGFMENNMPEDYFRALWQPLTNSSGELIGRYAYLVVDDQAKLNLRQHGLVATSVRTNFPSPASEVRVDVAEYTNHLSATESSQFRTMADDISSIGFMGQVFSNRQSSEKAKGLFTWHQAEDEDIVPYGYYGTNGTLIRYPDGAEPKTGINDFATNGPHGAKELSRLTSLSDLIKTNLPLFQNRDRSFTDAGLTNRYVERLAASIIDYVDEDSAPLLLADGEPSGKDIKPAVTTIAERWNWTQEAGSGSSWNVVIEHRVFVQIWNPYTTAIAGDFGLELETIRSMELSGAISSPLPVHKSTNTISIRPNEFLVLDCGTTTNSFAVFGSQPSALIANHPRMSDTASTNITKPLHSRYKAYWQGVLSEWTPNDSPLYDYRGPGLAKGSVGSSSSSYITLGGENRWSVNAPQVVEITGKGFRSVGDPLQNYLCNYVWEHSAYTNPQVRWKGRHAGSSGSTLRQDFKTQWALRDTPRISPATGTNAPLSVDPTTIATSWSTNEAQNAPLFVRNSPMKSPAELGNIYDPACVNDPGYATSGGNPASWFASGGGRSLRIGQREYSYPAFFISPSSSERINKNWNQQGYAAVQMLDLFTVNPTNQFEFSSTVGRVNINTASSNALAALFEGIKITSDTGAPDSAVGSINAQNIASIIISNRPYFSSADYIRFAQAFDSPTNYTPPLGGSTSIPANVMDRAREELFSSVVDLFTVQSRALRIYVVGQALNAKGKPVAESIIMAAVEIEPIGSGQGILKPIVKYSTRD